ncbi:MAG: hypothetical protein WDW36_008249 [Sanguina aurantia]
MHPALIPDRHPMCGKYMEALVACRLENPTRKFFGSCTEVTYQLTECLAIEKKITRAPRQQRYKERWEAKKSEDEERMSDLKKQTGDTLSEEPSQSPSDDHSGGSSSSGGGSSSSRGQDAGAAAASPSTAAGTSFQAASVSERSWISNLVHRTETKSGTNGTRPGGTLLNRNVCDGAQGVCAYGSPFAGPE